MRKYKLIVRLIFVVIMIESSIPVAKTEAQNTAQDSANSAIMKGDYRRAISLLKKIISSDSADFKAFKNLGFCYQSLFKHDSAVVYLEKADQIKPFDISNLLSLGRSYSFLGDNRAARNVFEQLLKIDSLNRVAALSLGNIYLAESEFNKADSLYQVLILQDSTNSYLFKQRGFCAIKLARKEDAVNYFRQSLLLNPDDIQVVLQLSQLYYLQEQLDSAQMIVDQGLEKFPENLNLIKRKAKISFKQTRYDVAIEFYEKVVLKEDASAITYKKLGMSYFFEKNSPLAVVNLLKSFEKDDSDPLTAFYIGLCYKDLNLYEKAILYLEKSLKLAIPDYLSDIYTHLASSQDHEKQFFEAIQSYREALRYDPAKKILTFYLASVYDQYYDDREIPLIYYQKFLRQNRDADPKLIDYAENRIKALKQELHFRRGKDIKIKPKIK